MYPRAFLALALTLVLALAPAPVGSYTQFVDTFYPRGPTPLRWGNGSVIRYTFNDSFAPGNNSDLVRAAFRNAFRAWMAVMPVQNGQPAVRFEEAGTTSTTNVACDHVNLITFVDTRGNSAPTFIPSPTGGVEYYFTPTGFTHFVCSGEDIFSPVGEIQDADMSFKPSVKFSTNVQATGTYDIQSVALNAIGSMLGLTLSGIASSAMAFPSDSASLPVVHLQPDDIAGLAAIYGPTGPAISGTVTDTSGTPVKSAHVVATDARKGITTASALTDQDGNYRIAGLPSSSYRVFAEPLSPGILANMPGIYKDGNTNFVTTFYPNPVDITGGEANNINIRITTPAAMNLGSIGVGGGCGVSSGPRSIRRGTDTSITLAGTNLSGEVRFSSPKITLRAPARQCGINQQTVFFTADVRVAPDAALGPTDIYFGSSSFTGGLVITVNPQVPSNGIVEAAASNLNASAPYFAPGSIISIFGQDLAESIEAAGSIPLPTQMAGVSVKVGDRLAPLYYVSPTQINAMIPFEVTGSSPAALIHQYLFNGNADDQAGSANGALQGSATASAGVLSLNGSTAYVQFGSHIVPQTGSYSVTLFVQESVPTPQYVEFISQGFSGGPGFYLDHDPNWFLRASDAWISTGVPFPKDGQRHHYALVVDAAANQAEIFVDGVLKGTHGAFTTTASGTHTRLGQQYDPGGGFFHGNISDVRIYQGALTSQQVAALAISPGGPPAQVTGNNIAVSVVAGTQSASTPVTLTLGSSAPRIFMTNAQGQGAILNGSRGNVLVDQSNPASAGDVLVIYCTGLGKVQSDVASGLASNGETTVATPQVTMGGRVAQVQFSGLAPTFVGLYQVNAVVPSGLAPGRVEVVISTSAGNSNKVSVSVQ